ncbi:Protein TSSC4 [Bienertia sinuspersici]
MEDTFRVRVDKTFNSLSSSSSSSSQTLTSPSLCLNELDFRKEVEDDLEELDDNDGEGTRAENAVNKCREVVCGEEDELDVKKSIGMDCTLDFEDEEDGYDKVAVGTEKNWSAHPKSILKRKDDQIGSKSEKRVRFEPNCGKDDHSTYEDDKIVMSEAYKESSSQQNDSSLIPDHVRHPLRYTHYTFDSSSDMNEESNRQAYMDFLTMVKKSKSEPEEVPADLRKPVIFNPKKKGGDTSMVTSNQSDHSMEEVIRKKNLPLSIAAGIIKEDESSEMEVDEHETTVNKVSNGRRTARKYRSKASEPNS